MATPKSGKTAPKLNQELIINICNVLRSGAYIETAAAMCGISKQVIYDWFKKANKQPNSIYAELLDAVSRAQEEATQRDLLAIERAVNPPQHAIMLKNENGEQLYDKDGMPHFIPPMKPDWNAAKWRLSRRYPKQWGDSQKIEHTGADGEELKSQIVVVLPAKDDA